MVLILSCLGVSIKNNNYIMFPVKKFDLDQVLSNIW